MPLITLRHRVSTLSAPLIDPRHTWGSVLVAETVMLLTKDTQWQWHGIARGVLSDEHREPAENEALHTHA